MDIVHALVAAGANIHLANHSGGTCLMNSVKCAQLASFLITQVRGYLFLGEDMISVIFHPLQGADVNAEDVNQRTALHLAIQEHRLDTVRLLVEAGADLDKRTRAGDDALQTACIKRALGIFTYLLEARDYPQERVCDAYDLMGASYIFETIDVNAAQFFWRRSIELRATNQGVWWWLWWY